MIILKKIQEKESTMILIQSRDILNQFPFNLKVELSSN